MSNLSQFFSGGSSIKSVQRGVLSFGTQVSLTATVSSVNPAKTELRLVGITSGEGGGNFTPVMIRLELTNSTTVTAYRYSNNSTGTVGWELTEWN